MSASREQVSLLNSDLLRRLPPTRRYLIGVSGGRDSVVLLHALFALGYDKLVICHLHHGLRGRSADADARFVERLAQEHGLRFEFEKTDVRELAKTQKQSLETAARAARYTFFAGVARRLRCPQIFLGHHADDLVETFLMNLLRGAGPLGLSAMREITSQKIGAVELQVIRPLLGIWRREIDGYVKREGIKFREDKTNAALEPTRNRLRLRIIPELEKTLGRSVRENIWRAANIAAEENEWLARLIERPNDQLSVEHLREQPIAAQRRILQAWLRRHEIPDVGFDLIERVRALLEPETKTAKTNLPRNRYVRRRAKKLFVDG